MPTSKPVSQLVCHPRRQIHTPYDNDIKQGKEAREITPRGHPQLNVRHALKSAAKFEKASYKRDYAKQGYAFSAHAQKIAQCYHQRGIEEKLSVGKTELEPE